jgi:hypothetical protein
MHGFNVRCDIGTIEALASVRKLTGMESNLVIVTAKEVLT